MNKFSPCGNASQTTPSLPLRHKSQLYHKWREHRHRRWAARYHSGVGGILGNQTQNDFISLFGSWFNMNQKSISLCVKHSVWNKTLFIYLFLLFIFYPPLSPSIPYCHEVRCLRSHKLAQASLMVMIASCTCLYTFANTSIYEDADY